MSTLAERFQFSGIHAEHRDSVGPAIGRRSLIPTTTMWPEQQHEPERPALTLESGNPGGTRLTRFDASLRELSDAQRRVLRLMLTGARIALVSGAAGEQRRLVARWLGAERVFLAALQAVQRDLDGPSRARLHGYVTRELMWENDEGLEAEAWATLAVIRALGRLDAETNLLEHSVLRATFWSTAKP
ncbi:MAG TPA: hypothetical protein VIC24_05915 [Gemmatimonadaceae bacterium]